MGTYIPNPTPEIETMVPDQVIESLPDQVIDEIVSRRGYDNVT